MSRNILKSDGEIWLVMVWDDKKTIMIKRGTNPCERLMELFYWCKDNRDGNRLEEKLPSLYKELNTLYISNKQRPLIETLEDSFETIENLIRIFKSDKDIIMKRDYCLYYVLLNFIDFLKTEEGEFIFYKVC